MVHAAGGPGLPAHDSHNDPVIDVDLSVVIVVHEMAREAPRTIASFSRPYQQGLGTTVHEVVVIDNGSARPFAYDATSREGTPVRVHHLGGQPSRSPARAVNVGVELARGDLVCVVVDGARMASPGLLHHALLAARLQSEPFVATLAWHLGPDEQARSVTAGYDQEVEDGLLAEIDWANDGYRLFDVSTPAPSSRLGYLMPIPESSALVLSKRGFTRIRGFDERFDQPGGGLAAADFFSRAVHALDEDPSCCSARARSISCTGRRGDSPAASCAVPGDPGSRLRARRVPSDPVRASGSGHDAVPRSLRRHRRTGRTSGGGRRS